MEIGSSFLVANNVFTEQRCNFLQVDADVVKSYFSNFDFLFESENWKEIVYQGEKALEAAKRSSIKSDEAKICAQLTSAYFYLGDYIQARSYAMRCHELSTDFTDKTLFLRALYLESAVYRALASKQSDEQAQQAYFLRAVEIAEEALSLYLQDEMKNIKLLGKIYFNLGAAHSDNSKGDLSKAVECYDSSLECFKSVEENDDVIRTSIRLGKVYLLQKQFEASQKIIDEIRSEIKSERLAMHLEYLEAQLKFALNETRSALEIAERGLSRAKTLGAKEDELRLTALIKTIEAKAAELKEKLE